jgi:hypothetical protein
MFAASYAPALKPSPFLNQHEEEVLGGIFGFSAEERAALREAGAKPGSFLRAPFLRSGNLIIGQGGPRG